MSNDEIDPMANLRTTTTEPVRMVSTANADPLRYGRRVWVQNPNKPGERRLARLPAHAHGDIDATHFHPKAKHWYEPGVRVDSGAVVNWPMTSGSPDLPTGQRHETHAQWVMNNEWMYQAGFVRTRVCFDEQIKRGLLNPDYVLRELVDGPPCDPSCCTDGSEGYEPWSGTPHCPKTRKERESRLARAAERYNEMIGKHEDAEMSHDLKVAKAANEHAASTLAPAIAEGMASAMKQMLEHVAPKSPKGKADK